MRLANKVSIVAGGGRGIGKAICLAFAREGADVLVADIVPTMAEEVSKEIQAMGRKSLSFQLDVTDAEQVKGMVKAAVDSFARIDVLANVAGIIIPKSPIEDVPEKDWDKVIAVNLKGTFLCSQAVGREMIKQGGGSIVNISSVSAKLPQIYGGAYSPSKAGVVLLTQIMAVEWAKHNIRVNALGPGSTATPLLLETVYTTEAARKTREKSIPMNRFATPEEMANGALFLASDDSSYVTGHHLIIDGAFQCSPFYLLGLLS